MNRRCLRLLLAAAAAAPLVASQGGCAGGSSSSGLEAYQDCLKTQTSSSTTTAGTPKGPFSAKLVEQTATALRDAVREGAKSTMRVTVESQRARFLAQIRCEPLRPTPEDEQGGANQDAGASAAFGGAGGEDPGDSDDGAGAREVSGTNNQVAGVDEADFVKNDAKYIYVANGSSFRIVEAWPAETAREIADMPVPGIAKKLFVSGDRALVYSSVPRQVATPSGDAQYTPNGGFAGAQYGSGECTYGFDGCVPAGDGTATTISVFDITNRAAPKLIRKIETSSSLVAARRIGNAVHTVLAQPSPSVSWQSWPEGLSSWYPGQNTSPPSEAAVNAAFDALLAKNDAAIGSIEIDALLPTIRDDRGQAPALNLYQSSMPDGSAITSVLSLDIAGDPSLKVASLLGRAGWVYASADALFIAVPHQQISGWGWYENRTENELSTVHAFGIGTTPGATTYRASGFVKGHLLNQFAMDEKDGKLRVATTTGHTPDPDVHSTITVLEVRQGSLEPVGVLDEIAKTEDIRSVRFDGDRGYVVTFKKTDPLFVFDLSNPAAPKTLGELKIPGFSTYMHMMDATHLLTIGYDAADQGAFAYFTGVLLQIFDVGNPADPKLVHKEVIGTRGSSSEALTNHLAFNYFAPKNLLALPMTICEGGNSGGGFGTEMTFSGLMVYDTTAATGFSLRGKVPHPSSNSQTNESSPYYDNAACSNWWTNAKSEVRRSIIMDDFVYSVSNTRIKVNSLNALATDLAEIRID